MIASLSARSIPWVTRTVVRPAPYILEHFTLPSPTPTPSPVLDSPPGDIKPCITCRHSRLGWGDPYDIREPRIECSLFEDGIHHVTGEKRYKSALEMRIKGQDDPDACGIEGRLYQSV